ncbi:uncharacterized protein LOC129766130 [Toxorhynchites rutilus septentrionalis]|uniref:uncharacterized protein LOC129766130 n=1 Tax=Toxorhynchites rutilus septentrionalis TaxID=329112 RepID=UPI002478FEF6|nr:uncharacterized protein LOC129766130 [Toxorhynchites rutilus septentrionalis]
MRCLLDSGSQIEAISERASSLLKVPCTQERMKIQLRLGVDSNPHALCEQPSETIDSSQLATPKGIRLADPNFHVKGPVDILLGARVFYQVLGSRQIRTAHGPTYIESKLGWLAAGSLHHNGTYGAPVSVSTLSLCIERKCATCHFKKCKERGDEIASEQETNTILIDNEVEQHFKTTHFINADGKYVVRIPLKEEINVLGSSREQADRRLLSLERRFAQNPQLKVEYDLFMKEYLDLGHMDLVKEKDEHKVIYYIPLSCVAKPDSTTTKLRVVYDASAKTTTGKSLNDIQAIGPVIQKDQLDLLLEFRGEDYVLSADITKMYRQTLVHDDDTWMQCIRYRFNKNEPIRTYRLKTVTYGEAASSFLACRALHQAGEEQKETDEELGNIIQQSFYVDNLMLGADSEEKLIDIRQRVEAALLKRGFPLRKWASNSKKVLAGIPKEDLEPTVRIGDQETIKTLGLNWAPGNDSFIFKVEDTRYKESSSMTKRRLASEILPLGLVQPAIVAAKILLQQLWKLQIHWDDNIPTEVTTQWNAIKGELHKLREVEFPRQVLPSRPHCLELHGFSDASTKAY